MKEGNYDAALSFSSFPLGFYQGMTERDQFFILQKVINRKVGGITYTPQELLTAKVRQAFLRVEGNGISDAEMPLIEAFTILSKCGEEESEVITSLKNRADYCRATLRANNPYLQVSLSTDETFDIFQRLAEEKTVLPKYLKDKCVTHATRLRFFSRVSDAKMTLSQAYDTLTRCISDPSFSFRKAATYKRCLFRIQYNELKEKMSPVELYEDLKKVAEDPSSTPKRVYKSKLEMALLKLNKEISPELLTDEAALALIGEVLDAGNYGAVKLPGEFIVKAKRSALNYLRATRKKPEDCFQGRSLFVYADTNWEFQPPYLPLSQEEIYHNRLIRVSLRLTDKISEDISRKHAALQSLKRLLYERKFFFEDTLAAAKLYLAQPNAQEDEWVYLEALGIDVISLPDPIQQIQVIRQLSEKGRFSIHSFVVLFDLAKVDSPLSHEDKRAAKAIMIQMVRNSPNAIKSLSDDTTRKFIFKSLRVLSTSSALSDEQKFFSRYLSLARFLKNCDITSSYHFYLNNIEYLNELAKLCEMDEGQYTYELHTLIRDSFHVFTTESIKGKGNLNEAERIKHLRLLVPYILVAQQKHPYILLAQQDCISSCFLPFLNFAYLARDKPARERMPTFAEELQKLIADPRLREPFANYRLVSGKTPTAIQRYLSDIKDKSAAEYKFYGQRSRICPVEFFEDEPSQKRPSIGREGQLLPPPLAEDLMDTHHEEGRRSADDAFGKDSQKEGSDLKKRRE